MSGLIIRVKGLVAPTGKKLVRDKSANAATRAIIDVSNQWSGGKKNLASGAQIRDLITGSAVAEVSKSHIYSGGGIIFSGINGDTVNLPDVAAPQPADTHWLITIWMKMSNYGAGTAASANNQTLSFSTTTLNNATQAMLTLVCTPAVGAVPTSISVYARGKNYSGLASALAPIYDNALHQVAFELQLSSDGTQQQLKVYVDGVAVYTSGYSAVATTVPAAPTQKYIGTSASFPLTWAGKFYRVRKDDLAATTLTAAEILDADLVFIDSRFS
ncbi:hypothetical protein [Klebsiella variicola]|uniref:hypothetical protein n=1 Tax=Klebsiella variicola TaxID=244366 RepID=UPI000671EAF2|nr:hypothetical protein [Klebsiella variicola]HCI4576411.1 hypothetical protein [Klebsiella variicola subsp. variicola]MDD9582617.1 hypothetical protein [Klebsiella variicola]MDD9592706.1 hypothetical protein [Klebsiella variicola]MDD9603709.1 hypothetical protein [Klebsiella variicola]MDD9609651.1 hypothetical protein [Klebsiella variicola]